MKPPAPRACPTCPHAHRDDPVSVLGRALWDELAAAPEPLPCHESFPDDWEERENPEELRECRGVLDVRAGRA